MVLLFNEYTHTARRSFFVLLNGLGNKQNLLLSSFGQRLDKDQRFSFVLKTSEQNEIPKLYFKLGGSFINDSKNILLSTSPIKSFNLFLFRHLCQVIFGGTPRRITSRYPGWEPLFVVKILTLILYIRTWRHVKTAFQ